MVDIITFFQTIPNEYRTIILIGGLSFLTILEMGFPSISFKYDRLKHIALNLFFTLTTVLINVAGASLILYACVTAQSLEFGILNLIELPIYIELIIGIMVLDLVGAWLVHFLEHKVKWMWKFHIIHHTDQYVDASTGLRHHPGEGIIRLCFTSLAVFISGASFGIVIIYQTLSVFFAHLTHANIKIPKKIDRLLSTFFVTPDFHKIHHHFALPKTDSHYGNIFSIWDRIFGTYHSANDSGSIVYGIDTHMKDDKINSFSDLFLIPFKKMRKINKSKFS